MQKKSKMGNPTAMTLLEMVIALAIMAIVFAAISPQFRVIRNSWDSKAGAAEALQNGRVLTDHLNRNLAKAVRITAVSEPNETDGFIEFEDNDSNTLRYDIAANNYVEFGPVGDLYDLAGPVSQLQFTCYDANDFNTPITDVNSIRFVEVETILTNSAALGQDKTFTASAYLRANGTNKGDSDLQTQIVYSEQNQNEPRCRFWDGSSWSAQNLANDVGAIAKWVVAAKCPTRAEIAAAVLDTALDLNVQFFDGISWSTPTEVADNLVVSSERPFYIAYERSSGDLLIVYRRGSDGLLYYRTYDGNSISSESTTSLAGSGNPIWIRLVANQSSDEIILLTLDAAKDVTASVWNGSTWQNTILLENNATVYAGEGIAAAYEGTSGQAIAAWTATGAGTFQYRKWNGSSWSAEVDGPSFGYDQKWLKLAADPCSNEIILASNGRLSNIDRVNMTVWNGSAWADPCEVCSDGTGDDRRCFDVAYENDGSHALSVYGKGNNQNCFHRIWNGSSWSTEQAGPGLNSYVSTVQLVPESGDDRIFVTVLNKVDDLESMLWDGSSLSSPQTLVGNAGGDNTIESFMVAVSTGTDAIQP